MTLLFYYLPPLQNNTDVTSRCVQFIFGDKGAATCLKDLCLKERGRECGVKGDGSRRKTSVVKYQRDRRAFKDRSCETDKEIQIGMTDRYRGTKVEGRIRCTLSLYMGKIK